MDMLRVAYLAGIECSGVDIDERTVENLAGLAFFGFFHGHIRPIDDEPGTGSIGGRAGVEGEEIEDCRRSTGCADGGSVACREESDAARARRLVYNRNAAFADDEQVIGAVGR